MNRARTERKLIKKISDDNIYVVKFKINNKKYLLKSKNIKSIKRVLKNKAVEVICQGSYNINYSINLNLIFFPFPTTHNIILSV